MKNNDNVLNNFVPSDFNTSLGDYLSFTSPFIFIKNGNRHERVRFDDILYLQAHGSYCKIVTSTKNFTLSICLAKVLKQINYPTLIRCHRSYAINSSKVTAFNETTIWLSDESQQLDLPISSSYRRSFADRVRKIKA